MELTTLVSPEEAKTRLRAYEAQRAEERTAEDEAIRSGYRAAARGLPVIELPATIHAGGYFPNGLPRLAIARADAERCWVHRTWWRDGRHDYEFTDQRWTAPHRLAVGRHRVLVSTSGPTSWAGNAHDASTLVPLVPPEARPNRRRLWRFHVLWEVERWTPVAPRDPALLRHIRGDLWAVVATWDLTDLERAVLSARAES